MAEQKDDLDRNEPPTAYKLEKARERGTIFRSAELTFAVVLIACVACVYGLSAQATVGTAALLRRGLIFAGRDELSAASAFALTRALGIQALTTVAPIVFVIWLTALLVAGAQARGVFSAQPLQPDFSRLNPATGLKRLFSLKSLHELWRSCAKIVVITVAMAAWGRHHLVDILQLTGHAATTVQSGVSLFGSALALLTGLALLFALLDWSINRWEFMRNMRMSKRDIKDEHKEREGDPRIKSRLRELRLEWLRRVRQLAKVRSADVLLTNPTHYAVALEYRHGEMPAPLISARGAGELAHRMRQEAYRRNVPVVEHAPLARALYAAGEAAAFVPEEHFEQVARVLRWVYAARGAQQAAQ